MSDSEHDSPAGDEQQPVIDVSPALGLAGHEQDELGTREIPDTADIIREDHFVDRPAEADPEDRLGADIATRGAGHGG